MANRIEESHPYLEHYVVFTEDEAASLRLLCEKTDLRSRGQCLAWVNCGLCDLLSEVTVPNVDLVLSVLEVLVRDRRRCVRIEATSAMDTVARWCPDNVWSVVSRLAASASPRQATCALCGALSGLLDFHFDDYFPRVRAAIEAGDQRMLCALCACRLHGGRYIGQLAPHTPEVDAFLLAHGVDPKRIREEGRLGCGLSAQRTRACDRVRNRIEESHPRFHDAIRLNDAEKESLRRLCEADNLRSRAHCLAWLHPLVHQLMLRPSSSAQAAATAGFVIACLEPLASDAREAIRGKALGDLSSLVDSWPHKLWPVAVRLAHNADAEVAELVPALILEHILESHFDLYYPHIRDAIETGDRRMVEMLDGCWRVGQARERQDEIDALLRKHGVDPSFRGTVWLHAAEAEG